MEAQFKKAVVASNVSLATRLINKGANVKDETFLLLCIEKGELEIAKLLVEIGANTTKPCANGKTPLSSAISAGNLEMVKLLLDNGAEFTMHQGLLDAIAANNLEIVSELIKRGVDIDSDILNQLVRCASYKEKFDTRILKLLVENGADLNVVKGDHYYVLQNSIQNMNVQLTEYLIKNIPDLDLDTNTPIMYAVCNNTIDCLKLLVTNGCKVNIVDSKGDTPLIKSVRNTNVPAIKYLIANKADLNVKNSVNESALSVALRNVDFRSFKILIESGADPKLATDEIEAKKKIYKDLAAYMSKLEQAKTNNDPLQGFSGHEATF